MIYEIKNSTLTAKINSFGAELISLQNNQTNTEFIWQGNDKYWNGHSPILFPFCGRLYEEKYTYKGVAYKMPLHGFASRKEFKPYLVLQDELKLILESDEETLKMYPFKFLLIVGFKLKGNKLNVSFEIKNKDDKELIFAIGAHPAFACPINNVGNFNDYFIEFKHNKYEQRLFTDRVLNSGQTKEVKLDNKKLRLHHDMFDNDAIFFTAKKGKDKLTLKSDLNRSYVKVSYKNMTCVGFWHTNKTDAPFVCIEPGHGFPGHDLVIEDIEKMIDMNKLGVGEKYFNSYKIEFFDKNN